MTDVFDPGLTNSKKNNRKGRTPTPIYRLKSERESSLTRDMSFKEHIQVRK